MRNCLVVFGAALFSCFSAASIVIDADSFAEGTDISNAFAGVVLSSAGEASGLDGAVYASVNTLASTGDKVFSNNLSSIWLNKSNSGYVLRADFTNLMNYITVDIIADSDLDIGVLTAYDSIGNVLMRVITADLGSGQMENISIQRFSNDIAYITIGGLGVLNSEVLLDNLTASYEEYDDDFPVPNPEPATMALLALGILTMRSKMK